MNRRKFITTGSIGAIAVGTKLPLNIRRNTDDFPALRFGLCADLHQDFYYDAPRRLSHFIDDMIEKKPDFIVQMGDFCRPEPQNKVIMDIWNKFPGNKYHVLGNHDAEHGFTKDQVMAFWNSKGKYYTFDQNGYHFVVMDGNDINPEHTTPWKYERYISAEQLAWLEQDLQKTSKPTIIFCHQGLDNDSGGIENATKVRSILDRANQAAGFKKVLLVFSGHHHQDYHNQVNGIHYIQINSMSYFWQGNKYAESPFGEELNKKYPLLVKMNHYKDPLWAYIEISTNGELKMHGTKSQFLGKSPAALGMPEFERIFPVVPQISDRHIKLTKALAAS